MIIISHTCIYMEATFVVFKVIDIAQGDCLCLKDK